MQRRGRSSRHKEKLGWPSSEAQCGSGTCCSLETALPRPSVSFSYVAAKVEAADPATNTGVAGVAFITTTVRRSTLNRCSAQACLKGRAHRMPLALTMPISAALKARVVTDRMVVDRLWDAIPMLCCLRCG